MCGVDLTRIDGIDVTTALVVVSEIGTDMSRFPTVKHFASWLGLCPGTKITGGKVMSGKTKRCANRAAQALRLAAAALRSSKSALGAYFRRMCSRMDKPKAVTAAAHKLARLIYTLLTKGEEYTDQGQDYFEERYRERVIRQISQRAVGCPPRDFADMVLCLKLEKDFTYQVQVTLHGDDREGGKRRCASSVYSGFLGGGGICALTFEVRGGLRLAARRPLD
jgi:hypothetical protein